MPLPTPSLPPAVPPPVSGTTILPGSEASNHLCFFPCPISLILLSPRPVALCDTGLQTSQPQPPKPTAWFPSPHDKEPRLNSPEAHSTQQTQIPLPSNIPFPCHSLVQQPTMAPCPTGSKLSCPTHPGTSFTYSSPPGFALVP